jgi:3,4-dihydroxy 2-butanone 4-phosphate synthase/GTP cyclohydrolase II
MPDLVTFAQLHGLKIATIADLIAYRRRNERLIDLVSESKINSRYGGEFRIRVYSNSVEYAEHIALIRGDISGDEPVLVRMHQANILADSLGDITAGEFFGGEPRPRSGELSASMRMIAEANRGVVVFIRETAPTFISRALKEREGHSRSGPISELRQYGLGAQILLDLGLKNVILLSNTQHNIVGLEGYGLTVVDQRPIPDSANKK